MMATEPSVPVVLSVNVSYKSRDFGPDYGSRIASFPEPFARQLMRDGRGRPAFMGPCSRETRRCDVATDLTQDTPACCLHAAMETLRMVAKLFDEFGVTWWADYGTLLGAIRNPMLGLEAGMIPHDKDCDLGVLAHDQETVIRLRTLFEEAGFTFDFSMLKGGTFDGGDRVKVRWSRTNHANTDVFFWHPRPDGKLERRAYIRADRCKGREFPASWLQPFHRLPFGDLRIPVPAHAEQLVEHRYGAGWRVPLRANNDGVERP